MDEGQVSHVVIYYLLVVVQEILCAGGNQFAFSECAAKQLVCIVEKAVEEYNVVVAQLALTDKEAGGAIVGHPDKGGINVLLEAVFFCSIHCFTVLRGCQASAGRRNSPYQYWRTAGGPGHDGVLPAGGSICQTPSCRCLRRW